MGLAGPANQALTNGILILWPLPRWSDGPEAQGSKESFVHGTIESMEINSEEVTIPMVFWSKGPLGLLILGRVRKAAPDLS